MQSNRFPWIFLVVGALVAGLLQIPRSGGSTESPSKGPQTPVTQEAGTQEAGNNTMILRQEGAGGGPGSFHNSRVTSAAVRRL